LSVSPLCTPPLPLPDVSILWLLPFRASGFPIGSYAMKRGHAVEMNAYYVYVYVLYASLLNNVRYGCCQLQRLSRGLRLMFPSTRCCELAGAYAGGTTSSIVACYRVPHLAGSTSSSPRSKEQASPRRLHSNGHVEPKSSTDRRTSGRRRVRIQMFDIRALPIHPSCPSHLIA
jgi:hypothetical protein